MVLNPDKQSFAVTQFCGSQKSTKEISNLVVTCHTDERRVICVDESGSFCRLGFGTHCKLLVRLEPPTKSLAVFGIPTFPNLTVVSTVGGTLVLDSRGGKLVELDQTQTRIALSDMTVYCGSFPGGLGVQATKNWVNVFSASNNYVYKTENGQKVIACASDIRSQTIGVVLGDGDLRGRGRVITLELSQDGSLVGKTRKYFLQELTGIVLSDYGIVVLTSDNSIQLLDPSSLSLKSHLKVNAPLKSIACLADKILVSSATGLLCEVGVSDSGLQFLSTRLVANEPVTLVGTGVQFAVSQNRVFRISGPELNLERLQTPPDTSGLFQISDSVIAAVVSGDICLFRLTDSAPFYTHPLMRLPPDYPRPSELLAVKGSIFSIFAGHALALSVNVFAGHNVQILHSLGSVTTACVLELEGAQCILSWSPEAGLVLTEGSVHLWSKTESEQMVAMAQLTPNSVICGFRSGKMVVMQISRCQVASTVSERSTWLTDLRKLIVLNQRIFAITESTGVYTLIFRDSDRALLFTAISPSHVTGERFSVTASAILDNDHVVIGESSGRMTVMRVPTCVRNDEKSHLRGFSSTADPALCMTVMEPVASIDLGVAVLAAVSSDDARRIVYLSTSDGRFWAVSPVTLPGVEETDPIFLTDSVRDPLLRYRLTAHVAWG